MNRRKPELQTLDISAWPTVAYTGFDEATRHAFELRMQAVVRYAEASRSGGSSSRPGLTGVNSIAGLNAQRCRTRMADRSGSGVCCDTRGLRNTTG